MAGVISFVAPLIRTVNGGTTSSNSGLSVKIFFLSVRDSSEINFSDLRTDSLNEGLDAVARRKVNQGQSPVLILPQLMITL